MGSAMRAALGVRCFSSMRVGKLFCLIPILHEFGDRLVLQEILKNYSCSIFCSERFAD